MSMTTRKDADLRDHVALGRIRPCDTPSRSTMLLRHVDDIRSSSASGRTRSERREASLALECAAGNACPTNNETHYQGEW